MTFATFNELSPEEQQTLLTKCCGSSAWVQKMLAVFPANDLATLLTLAEEKWHECTPQDWLEAFGHHPKIGDINSLKEKFASTAAWAANEQSAVQQTTQQVLEVLAEGNRLYEEKFGYIFIVCATGKSAEEMLSLLQSRLPNDAKDEIKIAAEEQNKITKLRLEKMFTA